PEILDLYTGNDPKSRHFLENVRRYNSLLNFASMKMHDERPRMANGQPCPIAALRISGQIQHFAGPLRPNPGQAPRGSQVFLLDAREQLAIRSGNAGVDPEVMAKLQRAVLRVNPFVRMYQQADEQIRNLGASIAEARIVIHAERRPAGVHPRQANAQLADELAVVVTNGESPNLRALDIVLSPTPAHAARGSGLVEIKALNPLRDPLHFVLLFPNGEEGYHLDIPKVNNGGRARKMVTEREYYAYKLHARPPADDDPSFYTVAGGQPHAFAAPLRSKKLS
ncbi:MAG: hypothetical protein AAF368_18915, partial [Planctomycetota bacterium]